MSKKIAAKPQDSDTTNVAADMPGEATDSQADASAPMPAPTVPEGAATSEVEATPVESAVTEPKAKGKAVAHHYIVIDALHEKLHAMAKAQGMTVSALVRKALTDFINGNTSTATDNGTQDRVDAINLALDGALAKVGTLDASIERASVDAVRVGDRLTKANTDKA